ncbi:MAG: hypothetical protein Q8O56_07605 [Solirubrobacteraceae bacterium]|nr:hypothetical protein [Solirubrobacteraceae bacterium]
MANDIYAAMTDLAPHLSSQYGLATFTFNAAGQPGGFWNDSSIDTTTLRGVTSGNLRQQLLGLGPYSTCNPVGINPLCEQGPLQIDAFFSADEANIDAVIPTADGGDCTVGGSTTACPGIAHTKTPIMIGRLVIYSCNAAYAADGDDPGSPGAPNGAVDGSGNGVPQSPRCEADPVTPAPTGMEGVITWLANADENTISIADPYSEPFGAAARQALIQAGFYYDDDPMSGDRNVWPGSDCDAQNPGVCKVRLESGITQVRGAVTSGTTRLGLVALSNLLNIAWTSGTAPTPADPNVWEVLNPSEYSGYGLIEQYGVGIRRSTPDVDKENAIAAMLSAWQDDTTIHYTLAAFGYGGGGPPPPPPPTGVTGPDGYCPNYVTGSATAHAAERQFTTYETSGDARGPHIWTASAAAYGYDCIDGTSRVFVDLYWDTTPLFSTPITAQYQVHRDIGAGAASTIFDIAPQTTRQCCWELANLPQVNVGPSVGLLDTFAVQPLMNTSPVYPYSLIDTTGGLQADFDNAGQRY